MSSTGKRSFAYGAALTQGAWPVQEDGFFADPSGGLFVLADGFGGRGGGDLASKLALQEARAVSLRELPRREGGIHTPVEARLRELYGEINLRLLQWNEKRAPSARGACSLVLAAITGRTLTLIQAGACSAALWREGRLLTLLSPQSPPRRSPGDALFPVQALGLGRELSPETRSLALQPGDLVILFSSGVAWESESWQLKLRQELADRPPGSALGLAESLLAPGAADECPWNRGILLVESLPGDSGRAGG